MKMCQVIGGFKVSLHGDALFEVATCPLLLSMSTLYSNRSVQACEVKILPSIRDLSLSALFGHSLQFPRMNCNNVFGKLNQISMSEDGSCTTHLSMEFVTLTSTVL